MTDLFIKPVPLPISRPSGLDLEYQPTTDFKRPLEATEKAAGAFSEGGSYPPTGEGVKRTSELLIGFKHHITEKAQNMAEIISQLQTGYLDGPVASNNFIANFIEFTIYSGLALGGIVILYLGYHGASAISRYFKGKR